MCRALGKGFDCRSEVFTSSSYRSALEVWTAQV